MVKKLNLLSRLIMISSIFLPSVFQRIPLKFNEEQDLWILERELHVSETLFSKSVKFHYDQFLETCTCSLFVLLF